jgi:hypothetical protein
MRTRIVRCQRFTVIERDGVESLLFFKLEIGRSGRFVNPPDMPQFEGKDGWVEILGPGTRFTVLRQVESPLVKTREATEAESKAIFAYRKSPGSR